MCAPDTLKALCECSKAVEQAVSAMLAAAVVWETVSGLEIFAFFEDLDSSLYAFWINWNCFPNILWPYQSHRANLGY